MELLRCGFGFSLLASPLVPGIMTGVATGAALFLGIQSRGAQLCTWAQSPEQSKDLKDPGLFSFLLFCSQLLIETCPEQSPAVTPGS